MQKNTKNIIFKSVLSCFMVTLFVSIAIYLDMVNELSNINLSMNTTDKINVTVQRWMISELTNAPNNSYAAEIEANINELNENLHNLHQTTLTSALHLSGNMDECSCLEFVEFIEKGYTPLKAEVYSARDIGWENTKLIFSGDTMHYFVDTLSTTVLTHFDKTTASLSKIQLLITADIFAIVVMAGFLSTKKLKELKEHKKLSEIAYLDTATGLFNRSKCEILFETALNPKNSSVCVMFDLNDLKLTNDTLGHVYGDRLIHDFAQLLKEANRKDPTVFMGRYGGDEFIMFYEDKHPDEVTRILSDLAELADVFNMTATDFQISYAVGVANSVAHYTAEKVSDIISVADELMYQNKQLVKARRAKEKERLSLKEAQQQVNLQDRA